MGVRDALVCNENGGGIRDRLSACRLCRHGTEESCLEVDSLQPPCRREGRGSCERLAHCRRRSAARPQPSKRPRRNSSCQRGPPVRTAVPACRLTHLLINKQTPLAAWDVPEDLVEAQIPFLGDRITPRRYLRATAARAAERMFAAARAAGHQLYGISGFRSFDRQQNVFGNHARAYGSVQKANLVSALPGQSEHQSGLALDLTSATAGYRLTTRFGDSAEGRWLRQHAARFGFILRYPQVRKRSPAIAMSPGTGATLGARRQRRLRVEA